MYKLNWIKYGFYISALFILFVFINNIGVSDFYELFGYLMSAVVMASLGYMASVLHKVVAWIGIVMDQMDKNSSS